MVSAGVIGRGRDAGLIDVVVHDLRHFTDDRRGTVDAVPYGGGPGMVLKAEPFMRAAAHIKSTRGTPEVVALMTPQGQTLTQEIVKRLSHSEHIVLLCGRYEGVDERVCAHVATEEISIGDYVLSGGELAAAVVLEAVARQIPGVVGDSESVTIDSFVRRILDFPHYTRPVTVRGHTVPNVLISGNHENIRHWRKRESVKRTLERRPDLLSVDQLDEEEQDILSDLYAEALSTGVET